MPKKNGIPKSLLADIKSVKTRLSGLERPKAILADIGGLKTRLGNLEKAHTSINKELKNFLKDKMSAGMSMIDAVKAWKEKEGGSSSSSMKQPGQDWQSPSQQY